MSDYKEVNEKLDALQTVLETERKSFKAEIEASTTKTKSDFASEQKAMQSDIDRLSDELESAVKSASRSGMGAEDKVEAEYKAAFGEYLRQGVESSTLKKAMNTGSGADGGFLISENLDSMIGKALDDESVMRQHATVMKVPNRHWTKNFRTQGVGSSWVGETAARPVTDAPQVSRIVGTYGQVYANPEATQAMLAEGSWNVEQFIADEAAREFSLAEETAFWTGSNGPGSNRPVGILTGLTDAAGDATRALGTLQHIEGALDTGIYEDLMGSLKQGYRSGAKFFMNRNTQAATRKLSYADSSPVVRLGDAGFTIGGYNIVTADDMPDVATGALAVAFGDMSRAYYILDVNGTTTIRDPYSNKPYVQFYTVKTVGSAVVDTTALKVIKFT